VTEIKFARDTEGVLQLSMTFELGASIEDVWLAWTSAERLRDWCAPHGFIVTDARTDLRPCGDWIVSMRSPDGIEFHVGGVYLEIVSHRSIKFTHRWREGGECSHETTVTVRFDESDRGVRGEFMQGPFESEDSVNGHREGWRECFERLVQVLTVDKDRSGSF